MATVQIKNVPEEVHRILRRRAADAGQSLQQYLLGRLVKDAAEASVEEVLRRAGEARGGSISFADAVAAVRAERDSR